jgi:hypothetical protein
MLSGTLSNVVTLTQRPVAPQRSLRVERRLTGEDPERRKTAAAELIAANPDVIVAAGIIDALPVLAQTRTIPIVILGGDLVGVGLADSLARSGGNVTGMYLLSGELDGKRLELLRELVPAATRISFLAYTGNPRSIPRDRHRGSGTSARRAGYRETGERRGGAGDRFCDQRCRP